MNTNPDEQCAHLWRYCLYSKDVHFCSHLSSLYVHRKYLYFIALIQLKPNLDSNVDLMALYKVYGYLFHSEVQDIEIRDPKVFKEIWWSWSYGSWIYNYLCNQCLSAITTEVVTTLCDKIYQWLATGHTNSSPTEVSIQL